MTGPVKLAVVGCGRIAQRVHLPKLARQPVRVVALADPVEARLDEAADRAPEARRYRDYRDLLSDTDAEAVLLTLPPSVQAAAAVAAFDGGKHVYLEKPGATAPAEVRAVLRAWRSALRVGVLGLNQRFHPMYREMREAVAGGRVGEVVGVRSVFCAARRELPAWKRRRATGGGVLLDLGVHHVDLARYVLGQEMREVSAQARSVRSEGDTATLTLRSEGGVPVQIFVSMVAAEQDRFEVYGTGGRLAADRYGSGRLRYFDPTRPVTRGGRVRARVRRAVVGAVPGILGSPDPSHAQALGAFLARVSGSEGAAPADLEDGYRSLGVVFAAEESVRRGGAAVEPAAVDPWGEAP